MIEKLKEINGYYTRYRDEVNHRNSRVIMYMIHGGIPISMFVIITQAAMQYYNAMMLAFRLLIYYMFLFVLYRPVLQKLKNQTILIYLLQIPVLSTALLMGTFMDREHQAITIFVFLSVLPIIILDRPLHLVAWVIGWLTVFVVCSYQVKTFHVFRGDLLYSLEFGSATLMTAVVITIARIRVIRDLKLAKKEDL